CWAEPLASAMPDWAFLSTESMRVSFDRTRCCVFSTSALTASTFWFTSPTSRCTYAFFAQPERARATATSGNTKCLTETSLVSSRGTAFDESILPATVPLRRRHVAATGAHDDPSARGAHFHPPEPRGSRRGVVAESILVLELQGDAIRCVLEPAEIAHPERRASREVGVAGENGRPLGGRSGLAASHEMVRGGIVEGRHDGNGVDGHVEGARPGNHGIRRLEARGVDAVGDHDDRPATLAMAG